MAGTQQASLGFDLVVFDMIGTTIQDSGEVAEGLRATLAEHGIEVDAASLRAIRGRSKLDAIRTLLSVAEPVASVAAETLHEAVLRRLAACFRERGARAVPGARECFAWLRARGVKVALTTGFEAVVAEAIVANLGWSELLDTTVCLADVPAGRPAPYLIFRAMERTGVIDLARVAAVGDTVADLAAAANARVGCAVGVLSGAHGRDELACLPHMALIESVAELPQLLECSERD